MSDTGDAIPDTDPAPPPSLGMQALALAQVELAAGVREHPPGSHRGPVVDGYAPRCVRHGGWIDVRGLDWCARFAGEMIWRAWGANYPARAETVYGDRPLWWVATPSAPPWPPVNVRAAVSELVVDAKATGTWHDVSEMKSGTAQPQPGDLLIFGRAGADPRTGGAGHVALVEHADYRDTWVIIGGNGPGGTVCRETRRLADGTEPVVGFISVQ